MGSLGERHGRGDRRHGDGETGRGERAATETLHVAPVMDHLPVYSIEHRHVPSCISALADGQVCENFPVGHRGAPNLYRRGVAAVRDHRHLGGGIICDRGIDFAFERQRKSRHYNGAWIDGGAVGGEPMVVGSSHDRCVGGDHE